VARPNRVGPGSSRVDAALAHVTNVYSVGDQPVTSSDYDRAMRPIMYRRIIVVLDGTPSGERGLGWVRQLARGAGSIVYLLSICPPGASIRDRSRVVAFADQVEDAARAAALAYLEPVAACLREDGLTVMTAVRIGEPAGAVCTAIAELSADLVVASTAGSGDLHRGLRHAAVPVMVTGPECRRSA
jgi:nucleotide-binding universal stress UspA family protein